VNIGERCVIGANSVVTKDVEPFTIVAGAPATVIRRLRPVTVAEDSGTAP
jgi:acetyltransferase-like isoleucine patch superfamily enzyme